MLRYLARNTIEEAQGESIKQVLAQFNAKAKAKFSGFGFNGRDFIDFLHETVNEKYRPSFDLPKASGLKIESNKW